MNQFSNYVSIDNPNVPVLQNAPPALPSAKFIEISEQTMDIDPTIGKLKIEDMNLTNFTLRVLQGEFQTDVSLVNQKNKFGNHINCCLLLNGESRTELICNSKGDTAYNGSQNFLYDPSSEFRHRVSKSVPFRVIHFSTTAEYFLGLLPHDEKWADAVSKKIIKSEWIRPRSKRFTIEQYQSVQNILNNPIAGKIGRLTTENLVLQILLQLINSLFQESEDVTSNMKFSRHSVDLLHCIKAHLNETYMAQHSLKELAMHFGINQNKLVTSFKSFFGISIFQYLDLLKMEYAKTLLQNGSNVNEVALILGYKNPHHFAAAFKKKFGITPSKLKANKPGYSQSMRDNIGRPD